MTELRWHPLLEEWVTVAPWRQDRTHLPAATDCPLDPTPAGGPETEIPFPDYHIAVFENRFPAYSAGGPGGRSEVVCYTSEHSGSLDRLPLDHVRDLVEVWADRTRELSRLPDVRYVFVFENRGEATGVTLHHPHGQIYAYPFVPPVVERELRASAAHRRRTGRCLYCDLVEAECGGANEVAEGSGWLAFVPPFCRWPFEVHVAPLVHVGTLPELGEAEAAGLAVRLRDLAGRYDRLFGAPLPYVMAVHQRPPGRGHRHHHLHLEFYPPNRDATRLKYLAGSELGAGAFILDKRSEDAARELRGA